MPEQPDFFLIQSQSFHHREEQWMSLILSKDSDMVSGNILLPKQGGTDCELGGKTGWTVVLRVVMSGLKTDCWAVMKRLILEVDTVKHLNQCCGQCRMHSH